MDRNFAKLVVRVIPGACPFAHTYCFGKFKVVIPPLCKINPWYEDLMALRFRALCALEA